MNVTGESTPAVESQVREIAILLSKAAKNYQVYLPNNRMFISSLAEVKGALQKYLDEYDVLTLVVKEFELLYDSLSVYSNQDKHQSIAFRMYRDGVRLISFHQGISEDELVAFFETLVKCLECENLEEDFVTLLWEKDLQSITYYEVSDQDTDFERRGKPTEGIDPEFQVPARDNTEVRWTDVTTDLQSLMPALELTAGDLEEVKGIGVVVEDDLFLKRSWQVISSTLDLNSTVETCLDLENAITGFLDVSMAMKQMGSAAEVLSDVTTRFKAFKDEAVDACLSRIISLRHGEGNMKVVGECLASDREAEHDQCLAYLSQLGPDALPVVIKLLPKCAGQSAKQVLTMAMASIGKEDPARIARCSECDSEEEAEVVLDALAAIGDESALLCAMGFHNHGSPKVRARVAMLAGKMTNPTAIEVTQALIHDSNPSVRRKALGSLVQIAGDKCVETLTGLFASKDFNLLPRDRKTSMLLVVRSLSPEDQTTVIKNIFRMRGWLRRRSLDETKAAAVDILHLMHADTVEYFAENLIQLTSGPLRKAAEATLKKVRRDDSGY